MNILGVCSTALDTISKVDHLPIVDSFCSILSTEKHQGGSGTNVLIQTAKLGAETGVITKVSQDEESTQIIENLRSSKINIAGIVRQEGSYAAPQCLIYVDPHGAKTLILDREHQLPPMTKEEINWSLVNDSDIVFVDFNPAKYTPEIVRRAAKAGKKVVVNVQEDLETLLSKGITKDQILAMLPDLSIFAPCQEGIKGLSGSDDVDGQIAFIRKYYDGIIVLTLGDQGVVASDGDGTRYNLPAYSITPIDTTGAGDSFLGSLMVAYYVKHLSLEDSLQFATAAAAFTCMEYGAQTSPTTEEVLTFMKSHRLVEE